MNLDIKAIKARLAAATPGSWESVEIMGSALAQVLEGGE